MEGVGLHRTGCLLLQVYEEVLVCALECGCGARCVAVCALRICAALELAPYIVRKNRRYHP